MTVLTVTALRDDRASCPAPARRARSSAQPSAQTVKRHPFPTLSASRTRIASVQAVSLATRQTLASTRIPAATTFADQVSVIAAEKRAQVFTEFDWEFNDHVKYYCRSQFFEQRGLSEHRWSVAGDRQGNQRRRHVLPSHPFNFYIERPGRSGWSDLYRPGELGSRRSTRARPCVRSTAHSVHRSPTTALTGESARYQLHARFERPGISSCRATGTWIRPSCGPSPSSLRPSLQLFARTPTSSSFVTAPGTRLARDHESRAGVAQRPGRYGELFQYRLRRLHSG